MVKNPLNWVKKLLKLGFERIIVHLEAAGAIKTYLKLIRDHGAMAVLAINPETKVEKLNEFVSLLDGVLVMGVHPGFQGQSFVPGTIDKIAKIKSRNWPVIIEVDGAVKDWNTRQLIQAGADILIVGSFLVNGNPDENLEKLKNL